VYFRSVTLVAAIAALCTRVLVRLPKCSDQALDEGILPGRLRRDQDFLDAQVGDALAEDLRVDVPDQILIAVVAKLRL
jgi:hypothetical protein